MMARIAMVIVPDVHQVLVLIDQSVIQLSAQVKIDVMQQEEIVEIPTVALLFVLIVTVRPGIQLLMNVVVMME